MGVFQQEEAQDLWQCQVHRFPSCTHVNRVRLSIAILRNDCRSSDTSVSQLLWCASEMDIHLCVELVEHLLCGHGYAHCSTPCGTNIVGQVRLLSGSVAGMEVHLCVLRLQLAVCERRDW